MKTNHLIFSLILCISHVKLGFSSTQDINPQLKNLGASLSALGAILKHLESLDDRTHSELRGGPLSFSVWTPDNFLPILLKYSRNKKVVALGEKTIKFINLQTPEKQSAFGILSLNTMESFLEDNFDEGEVISYSCLKNNSNDQNQRSQKCGEKITKRMRGSLQMAVSSQALGKKNQPIDPATRKKPMLLRALLNYTPKPNRFATPLEKIPQKKIKKNLLVEFDQAALNKSNLDQSDMTLSDSFDEENPQDQSTPKKDKARSHLNEGLKCLTKDFKENSEFIHTVQATNPSTSQRNRKKNPNNLSFEMLPEIDPNPPYCVTPTDPSDLKYFDELNAQSNNEKTKKMSKTVTFTTSLPEIIGHQEEEEESFGNWAGIDMSWDERFDANMSLYSEGETSSSAIQTEINPSGLWDSADLGRQTLATGKNSSDTSHNGSSNQSSSHGSSFVNVTNPNSFVMVSMPSTLGTPNTPLDISSFVNMSNESFTAKNINKIK